MFMKNKRIGDELPIFRKNGKIGNELPILKKVSLKINFHDWENNFLNHSWKFKL